MSEPYHFMSLGAGVQSSTMAMMAAAGEITPMPQGAIFADTQGEPKAVYDWLDWLEKQLPFPVYRVSSRDIVKVALAVRAKEDGEQWVENVIPAHIDNGNGKSMMIQRQCTRDFKIRPITRKVRELCGNASSVQWIGISLDEVHRMKMSQDKRITHRWPLVEKRMKRHDCLRWMEARGHPKPPRSACYFCPMKANEEWRDLRDNHPDDWAKAVAVDRDHRALKASLPITKGLPFLHPSLVPLDQVDLSTDAENGQGLLWGNECEGMCGV